jgi:hypothetical protein
MNILAAVLLFCAMPLVIAGVVRVFAAGARSARPWRAFLGIAGCLAALCVAAAVWMSRSGMAVSGVLAGKNETLSVDDTGLEPGVQRRFTLTLADPDAQARFAQHPLRGDLEVDVNEELYDALRQNQSLGLHEWIIGPLKFARPDALPWWDLAPGLLDRLTDALGWPRSMGGGAVHGEAEVDSVRTVRDAYPISLLAGGSTGGVHVILKQPYDEVRLRVRTSNGVEALALDRVDAGSGETLTPRIRVKVTYPARRPRAAQMDVGTRRYRLRNSLDYWRTEVIGVAALIAVVLAAYAVRRGRRSLIKSLDR